MTQVWTDGSASSKDRTGGWAFLMRREDGREANAVGHHHPTTVNEMELYAIFRALWRLDLIAPAPVTITSDSNYAIGCLGKFRKGWEANEVEDLLTGERCWLNSQGQPVKNQALIRACHARLDALREMREVTFRHVRGHSGDPGNEWCDTQAGYARREKVGAPGLRIPKL